jgi:galactose mutarotase-like enzyme
MTMKLETITLTDGDTRVTLAPARGGMATRFSVGTRAVFFLDESTLVDETKNVRGGTPVLFPSPGPLASDRFERGGKSGAMKQHGFARSRAWSVSSSAPREAVLRLASDDATRAQYPWDFEATFRYSVSGATLRIDQRFENTGQEPMPFAAGFHPYFHVADAEKSRARIPTAATRAWDNVTKRNVMLSSPIDLAQPEVDLHLVDHGRAEASLELGDGARVVVRGSDDYRRWVIWTLASKDFVCLEPWTAPANALNTGDGLTILAPGATREMFVELALG